jgi:Flp pilus assembly protein TadD
MKDNISKVFLFLLVFSISCLSVAGQGSGVPPSELDKKIAEGLQAVSKKNWAEARRKFEDGLAIYGKTPEPSEYLMFKLELPDEDKNDVPSSPGEAGFMRYRHAMGTNQALLQFFAFTAQLEGNDPLAEKYFVAVYRLQGPLWGTSWQMYIPPIQALFHLAVPKDNSENYGRYLFRSGQLLWDSHNEMGKRLIEEAQKLIPNDAKVSAMLGSIYMVLQDPVKAKPQSQQSLSIDPKQPHVLIDLATANWLLGDFETAVKNCNSATDLDPELPGPYMLRGLVLIENGDLQAAAKQLEKAITLSRNHPFYLTIKAAVLEASGDAKAADKLMATAWEGDPPNIEQFEKWYLKHKPLALVKKILQRSKH